jgi:hypothetical protein
LHLDNPITCTWDDYLIATLAIESSAAANNWMEFQQLVSARRAKGEELTAANIKPTPEEELYLKQSEERTMNFLTNRKRQIAHELTRISGFKKAANARRVA